MSMLVYQVIKNSIWMLGRDCGMDDGVAVNTVPWWVMEEDCGDKRWYQVTSVQQRYVQVGWRSKFNKYAEQHDNTFIGFTPVWFGVLLASAVYALYASYPLW